MKKQKTFLAALSVTIFLSGLVFPSVLLAASQSFASSGSFTVPAGVTSIIVSMASGGGGGGCGWWWKGGGGGGGGKIINNQTLAVTPSATYLIVVGSGGAGCSQGNGASGGNGGTSSFGALLSASGGIGGETGAGDLPGGPLGGHGGAAGGSGCNAGSNNNLLNGGGGGDCPGFGAGGSAGKDRNPGPDPVNGGSASGNAAGGGGGGGDSAGIGTGGGNGASGFVNITYTAPPAACAVVNYNSTAANPCPSGGTLSGGNCVTTSTYAAIPNNVSVAGTTGTANIDSSLQASGNQICLWGSGKSAATSKGCVTIAGATASGTTGTANIDSSLQASGNQICLWGNPGGNKTKNLGCITLTGATASGTTGTANIDSGLQGTGNQLCYWGNPGGNKSVNLGCITITPNTYSCNSGDGAPVGQTCTTTSSYPQPTQLYNCSNVCSSTFSNTQASFTSSDAACTTPTSSVTYSLNCNCGVKALPAKAPINESSCTACTQAGQPPAPQAGICGTANGTDVTTLAATDAGLCQNGSVDLFTGSGPWTWNCKGNWGGSSVACGATKKCVPAYDFVCGLIPTGTCDDTTVGKKIVAQTPACNKVGKNACSVGGIAGIDECAAAGVSCPAPVEKVCQAPLSVTNWKEVAPK
jgi:hypothetical protein